VRLIDTIYNSNLLSINTAGILIPYEYASDAVDLNWSDLSLAIEHGLLCHQAAIEHAKIQLEGDDYLQEVLDLACLSPEEVVFSHSIHPFIDELAKKISEEDKRNSVDKWMFILLKWVYDHKDDFDDPFEITTIICGNFGYPDNITHFAWKYAPIRGSDLGSTKNVERAYQQWREFIDTEAKRWKS